MYIYEKIIWEKSSGICFHWKHFLNFQIHLEEKSISDFSYLCETEVPNSGWKMICWTLAACHKESTIQQTTIVGSKLHIMRKTSTSTFIADSPWLLLDYQRVKSRNITLFCVAQEMSSPCFISRKAADSCFQMSSGDTTQIWRMKSWLAIWPGWFIRAVEMAS